MLKFFDTHAHYMDERFKEDKFELLKNLNENHNISHIINIGYDMPSSYEAVELAKKYDFCYCAVGIHPHDSKDATKCDYEEIKKLAAYEKTVAIGEIGLDYYYDNSERNIQKKVFADQLDLAKEVKLPVVIHSRDATKDTLDIIKSKDNIGVFHCFSGSVETAKEVLGMGYYISFAGPVTFKNSTNLKEVAKYVPLDRFFIETDCPYLAPVPNRGKRNDSSNLKYIAGEIAALRGITIEEVADISLKNSKRFFGIKE